MHLADRPGAQQFQIIGRDTHATHRPTQLLRNYVGHGFSLLLSVVVFAPQGEKNNRQKKKSTMLPQAKAAYCVSPTTVATGRVAEPQRSQRTPSLGCLLWDLCALCGSITAHCDRYHINQRTTATLERMRLAVL